MIHIKRFSPGKRRWIKNTTKVDYPLKLDTTTIKPLLSENSKDKFNGYRLTGVCCHKGNTAGGHYVSYTKNFEDLKWYKQDDEKVSPACASGHSITAYILFYHKF
jgi:ubiquitin C-terminal hydrolase